MSLAETRRTQIFPVLDATQIAVARRFAAGSARRLAPGEIAFALGERHAPSLLVVEGAITVRGRDGAGHESDVVTHGPGEITGEVSQLADRPSLAEGRAGPQGAVVLPFDAAHLRALLVGSAELGEIIMRAFILRRVALLTEGHVGAVLVGHTATAHTARLENFLRRNGTPHSIFDPARDEEAAEIVERFGLHEDELPVVICPSGSVLRRPSEAEVGACLGITPEIDQERLFDVAVVGAGPAGLATAVYAASEGLSVLVLDRSAPGGQAGASARIENYLGFPTGISGQALAGRAFTQAQKFGAEIAIPVAVDRLECGVTTPAGSGLRLHLEGGRAALARSVVVASGARYRRPAVERLAEFEGAGVSYWASPVEATLCAGEEVALVGAGNSAGQAVAFLAPRVRHLHLLVRGEGLEQSMSRYLIERIAALPNVTLHTGHEVSRLEGDRATGLSGIAWKDRKTGQESARDIRHLFLFIGADPNAEWLASCEAQLDRSGFVRTGEGARGLETTVPGVFAIGDVRAGSTKRVAAAVGEGAAAVAQLHNFLAG